MVVRTGQLTINQLHEQVQYAVHLTPLEPQLPVGEPTISVHSTEMIWFWGPPLGPTAMTMTRMFSELAVANTGTPYSWHDISTSLGLGDFSQPIIGINHPAMRTLYRIITFGKWVELRQDVLFVPSSVPLPPQGMRRRWSPLTHQRYAQFINNHNEGEHHA